MPFETIRTPNGIFKAEGLYARFLSFMIGRLGTRFTPEGAKLRLRLASKLSDPVVACIDAQQSLSVREEVYRILDDVVLNQRQVFDDHFRCIEFPRADGDYVRIPDAFKALADFKVEGIGAGEILPLVLFKDQVMWLAAGGEYDSSIDGEHWHSKDRRTGTSTPLGNTADTAKFYETPIIQFISQRLKISQHRINVGMFKGPKIESAILSAYEGDLMTAAALFEKELQETFRESAYLGDAVGMLSLEYHPDDGGLILRRIDKKSVCFSEKGGRGVKWCSTPNRFADSITARVRVEQKEKDHRDLMAANAAARKAVVEKNRLAREKVKEEAAAKRILESVARAMRVLDVAITVWKEKVTARIARRNLIDTFVTTLASCVTIKDAAEKLFITVSLAGTLKKEAIALGYTVTTKPREMKVKNENRNRRRKHETGDQGSLGADPAGVERKRRRKASRLSLGSEDQGRIPDDQGQRYEGNLGKVPGVPSSSQRSVGDGGQPDPACL